jgi:hypothetical protein
MTYWPEQIQDMIEKDILHHHDRPVCIRNFVTTG